MRARCYIRARSYRSRHAFAEHIDMMKPLPVTRLSPRARALIDAAAHISWADSDFRRKERLAELRARPTLAPCL